MKRSYYGCEHESKLYWEVYHELRGTKGYESKGNNSGTKRGKRSTNNTDNKTKSRIHA